MIEVLQKTLDWLVKTEDTPPIAPLSSIEAEIEDICDLLTEEMHVEGIRNRVLSLAIETPQEKLAASISNFFEGFSARRDKKLTATDRLELTRILRDAIEDLRNERKSFTQEISFSLPYNKMLCLDRSKAKNHIEAKEICVDRTTQSDNRLPSTVIAASSIEVRPNQLIGVIGKNGSGKSTLLEVLSGQIAISSGYLTYGKIDEIAHNAKGGSIPFVSIPKIDSENWSLRKRLGFFSGHPTPNLKGNLRTIIHAYSAYAGLTATQRAMSLNLVLMRYHLSGLLDRDWVELSPGERVRFHLACGVVSRPLIFFLDEPLAPLDEYHRLQFLNDLREIANCKFRPVSVVFSTHNISEAETFCDKLYTLQPQSAAGTGSRILAVDEQNSMYESSLYKFTASKEIVAKLEDPFVIEWGVVSDRVLLLKTQPDASFTEVVHFVEQAGVYVTSVENLTNSAKRPQIESILEGLQTP